MKSQDTVNDKEFGEMQYKHSWKKKASVSWWAGREISLDIIAQAYSGQEISEPQRGALKFYKEKIGVLIDSGKKSLVEYIRKSRNIDYSIKDLEEILNPTAVVFNRDGTLGILFDADFDAENGVALFNKEINGDLFAGEQDEFL